MILFFSRLSHPSFVSLPQISLYGVFLPCSISSSSIKQSLVLSAPGDITPRRLYSTNTSNTTLNSTIIIQSQIVFTPNTT